jgi:hypothetical protein
MTWTENKDFNKTQKRKYIKLLKNVFYLNAKFKKFRYSMSKSKKGRKWSTTYKKSINCNRPKGFSQKQYCKYGKTQKKIETVFNK